jgi:hypothetical protein
MKQLGTISAEQFMLHFYEDIRVPVNWQCLLEATPPIDCIEVEGRDDLGDCSRFGALTLTEPMFRTIV